MRYPVCLAITLGTLAAWASAAAAAPASTEPGPPALNTWLVLGPFAEKQTVELARDVLNPTLPGPAEGQAAAGETWAYFDDRLFSRNYDDYQDLLNTGEPLPTEAVAGRLTIDARSLTPDPVATIIALNLSTPLRSPPHR